MNQTERFVLPFRWREFGRWFAENGGVLSHNSTGRLEIKSTSLAAQEKKIKGIEIKVEVAFSCESVKRVFLCAFIADLNHNELFEPFIGNPDSFAHDCLSGKYVEALSGAGLTVDLLIPEQGWVLPSIWRFMVESIGLKHKEPRRQPDLLVFAFDICNSQPLLFAACPFDYFGQAALLKDRLVLEEFFELLKIDPNSSESDIQRAYIHYCREFQRFVSGNFSQELFHKLSAKFSRIKHGYHLWAEKVQGR